jgi:hypothetical protein
MKSVEDTGDKRLRNKGMKSNEVTKLQGDKEQGRQGDKEEVKTYKPQAASN